MSVLRFAVALPSNAAAAAGDGFFKHVGIGGFVGGLRARWFHAQQGAEFGDERLGIGAFSGAGSRPADDCAKETNDLVAKMGIFGGSVGVIFAVAHLNL